LTAKEANIKFSELQNSIIADMEKVIPYMIRDYVVDAVTKRVSKGEKAEGGSFSPYSEKWAKERAKKGLGQTKNFLFTGNMWNQFSIQQIIQNTNSVTTILNMVGFSKHGIDKENKNSYLIALSNSNKENEQINKLSKKEIDGLNDLFKKYINKKLWLIK
jgi:hypothetical protein